MAVAGRTGTIASMAEVARTAGRASGGLMGASWVEGIGLASLYGVPGTRVAGEAEK